MRQKITEPTAKDRDFSLCVFFFVAWHPLQNVTKYRKGRERYFLRRLLLLLLQCSTDFVPTTVESVLKRNMYAVHVINF